jgi:phosphate transport system permease protein
LIDLTAPDTTPLGDHRPPGRVVDRVFRVLAATGGILVLVILALILATTTRKAWPAFADEGVSFVTSSTWDVVQGAFGTLAFTFGTLVISVIALAIAVPVSLGVALFVTELVPARARRAAVFVIDLLAAVPSVVFGLWGILVLAPALTGFYTNLSDAVSGVPVLRTLLSGDPISGRSFFTAGLILAIMITPIITSVTRETFATVPRAQKDGAFALGATRWEMIRGAVFPHSRSGIVAGVLLGFGRAIGETIAVALVIGSSPQITARLFSAGDALSAVIANQFGESTGVYQAALIGMGVLLFAITLVISMIARGVIHRAERRIGSASA